MRFYHAPVSETSADGYCTVWVAISPGHYGRSIGAAQQMVKQLRARLGEIGVVFEEVGEDATSVEIGNTEFDKNMMRVLLHIKVKAERRALKADLERNQFTDGIPAAK